MYSKDEKSLAIGKIHHKRKVLRILSTIVLIMAISPITLGQQLVLLDVTYDHTKLPSGQQDCLPALNCQAFSFFNLPSGMPSNLLSPVNYAQGTLYQRLQVITKPSAKTVKYQICVFQDQYIPSKHACSNQEQLAFTNLGTYYASQPMTSLFQYGNLNWGRSLLRQMLVVKDINGKPVDERYGWLGTWSGSPNFALYYPMKVRYTAIIVPPGGGSPIWPGGSSNGVTVLSPNGGENLLIGSSKTISWSSTNAGTNVKIELLKGGVLNTVISSSTSNTGSYNWAIPSTHTLGTDYKVRITSTSNPTYTDSSNSNFAISSNAGTITVTTPNGGNKWIRGTTNTIKWSYTGSPGSNVKIELLKGGVLNRVISSSAPIGSSGIGSYSWLIPTTQAIGSDYKIRITSTSNSAYTDVSNSNFVIGSGTITISYPNGGESLARGSSKTITWSKAGSTGSYVKIELFKAGVLNRVITTSTYNDGSYVWNIPPTQTIGSDYKIKITSTSNSIYNDWSNSYFKIY